MLRVRWGTRPYVASLTRSEWRQEADVSVRPERIETLPPRHHHSQRRMTAMEFAAPAALGSAETP